MTWRPMFSKPHRICRCLLKRVLDSSRGPLLPLKVCKHNYQLPAQKHRLPSRRNGIALCQLVTEACCQQSPLTSVHLPTYLPIHPSIYLSINLSVRPCVNPSVYQANSRSLARSLAHSLTHSLSLCLSLSLSPPLSLLLRARFSASM